MLEDPSILRCLLDQRVLGNLILALWNEWSSVPVLTPPVKIQAPVVTAALISPFPNTCLSLGCSSKFCRPPWTEMRRVGSSSCQSFTIRCSRESGLESCDTRMYCGQIHSVSFKTRNTVVSYNTGHFVLLVLYTVCIYIYIYIQFYVCLCLCFFINKTLTQSHKEQIYVIQK